VLIAHGTGDQIVEFAQGIALKDELSALGVPVEFHEIKNGTHEWADKPSAADGGPPSDFGTVTAEFFDRVL
jgi:dipeptidyl aminopeptidase/acylaminoacyl peptidase